jgi:hypothetical protein
MMFMRFILSIVLVLSIIGCEKDKDQSSLPDGVYQGTFQRTGGPAEAVTLNITGNGFSGQSTVNRYPVIGKGTYAVSGGEIIFQDTLFYTADFDWTLILSDEYKISQAGDSITIWREYNAVAKDIYRLKKQK